ncbi:sodium-dependent glucose transporter 1A-like [Glandiceps talaboti]
MVSEAKHRGNMQLSNGDIMDGMENENNTKPTHVDLLTEQVLPEKTEGKGATYSSKVLKTVLIYFAFFGLGLCISVVGPSLPDLQFQTNASLQQITFMFTARSTGYLIGAMIGGACFDRFENQLLLALSLFGSGVTGLFLPWCSALWLLITFMAVWGFCSGFLDTGGNVVCVNIWEKDSGPWMQALHFFFALGATVAPLIAGPFLTPPLNNTTSPSPSLELSTMLDLSVFNESILPSELIYTVKPLGIIDAPHGVEKLVSKRDTELKEFEKILQKMIGRIERSLDDSNSSVKTGGLVLINTTESSQVFIQSSPGFSVIKTSTVASDGDDAPERLSFDESGNETLRNNSDIDSESFTGNGTLWIPYTLISLYHFLVSIPFFWLFMKDSRQVILPKKVKSKEQPGNMTSKPYKENHIFRVTLLIFLFLFCFAYVGHEALLGSFIYTFALKSNLGFTIQTASFLNSVFWGSFAAARGMGICCAMLMSPRTMLIIDLIGLCTASSLLVIFGGTNVTVLWGASVLLGISMATVFPTVIAWSEHYILLTGKATAIFCMAAAASEMLIPWIVGMLFESYSNMIVMYFTLGLSISTTIIFVLMQILASCHGERPRDKEEDDEEENKDINPETETIQLQSHI